MVVLDKVARCLSLMSGLEFTIASFSRRGMDLVVEVLSLSHASQNRCVSCAVAMLDEKKKQKDIDVHELDEVFNTPPRNRSTVGRARTTHEQIEFVKLEITSVRSKTAGTGSTNRPELIDTIRVLLTRSNCSTS